MIQTDSTSIVLKSDFGEASPRRLRVFTLRQSRAEPSRPVSIAAVSSIDPKIRARCAMIRKLKSGEYRLYSRKPDARTGKRRNLGTFKSRKAAEQHEREVQFFKRRG
jgi:hypothetical protein